MAKKTISSSIEERLRDLFELQTIDSKKDEIKILKGALPIEVSDLEDEISGFNKRIEKLNEQVDEIDGRISKHNENIKTAETLSERYNKQLDDVKNNREFEALQKEIELQSLEVQLSEKRIREANEEKVKKVEILAETQERIAAKQDELTQKKEELEKIIAKTDKEEKTLQNKSDKQRNKIEARLLKAYDKARSAYRNGLAVVTHRRGSCGGCFNRIPPQLQIEIGMRKEILACEHCGRVLVDHEIAGIAEEAEA
jgi:predicted  nucleic acid-binding Zn-ribbon protein